jgi:hypothetical protein
MTTPNKWPLSPLLKSAGSNQKYKTRFVLGCWCIGSAIISVRLQVLAARGLETLLTLCAPGTSEGVILRGLWALRNLVQGNDTAQRRLGAQVQNLPMPKPNSNTCTFFTPQSGGIERLLVVAALRLGRTDSHQLPVLNEQTSVALSNAQNRRFPLRRVPSGGLVPPTKGELAAAEAVRNQVVRARGVRSTREAEIREAALATLVAACNDNPLNSRRVIARGLHMVLHLAENQEGESLLQGERKQMRQPLGSSVALAQTQRHLSNSSAVKVREGRAGGVNASLALDLLHVIGPHNWLTCTHCGTRQQSGTVCSKCGFKVTFVI